MSGEIESYGEWFFYANGYDKGSKCNRLTLWRQVEKTTGRKPKGLTSEPVLSYSAAYYWTLYIEIKNGCDNVTYMDLIAWQSVTGVTLTPWEASTMIRIDKMRISRRD